MDLQNTSGLGNASQAVSFTGTMVVPSGVFVTAASGTATIRLAPAKVSTVVRREPEFEMTWKRVAVSERKRAKRKFKPSDVDKAVATSRYRR
jgi:hypothetical protein